MKPDYLYGTDYHVFQEEGMYHFNSDTEFLGHFMRIRSSDHVLDAGCAGGALLLYAARFSPASLTGIDLFPEVIGTAERNMAYNEVQASFAVSRLQDYEGGPFDVLVSNPPYFATGKESLKNENRYLKAARHEEYLTCAELVFHLNRLMKQDGRIFIVYLASRLRELLAETGKNGLVPVRMRFAHPSASKPARSVCLELRRDSNAEFKVESPVLLNDRSTYAQEG